MFYQALVYFMVNNHSGDIPIDLDKYPDQTKLILAVLNVNNKNRSINGRHISGMSLKEIADQIPLSKSQVRNRINQLVGNEHLMEKDPYPNRPRSTRYYELRKSAEIAANKFNLDGDFLSDISRDPTSQDMMNLLSQMAKNEAKITDIRAELGSYEHVVLDN